MGSHEIEFHHVINARKPVDSRDVSICALIHLIFAPTAWLKKKEVAGVGREVVARTNNRHSRSIFVSSWYGPAVGMCD